MSADKALEQLGGGYLRHPSNEVLRQRLRSAALGTPDFERQLTLILERIAVACLMGLDPVSAVTLGGSFGPCPPWLRETPDLERAEIAAEDLEAAASLLAIDRSKGDELGRIRLDVAGLHASVDVEAQTLTMVETPGGRAHGMYYTPDALVECLLDHSLEPVIREAMDGKSPDAAEKAVLGIRVLDPAVGSGRFLVAAARRLTRKISQSRSARRVSALSVPRDVVEKCLYGVDIDPTAISTARTALWLEAGRPADVSNNWPGNLRVGNALVGATHELTATGIPDRAYEPIGPDDAKVCADMRKRNRSERTDNLDIRPDRRVWDAWCAAHTMVKSDDVIVPTTGTLGQLAIAHSTATDTEQIAAAVAHEAKAHRFFHWPLEFANVGFDVVVGNPPFANAIERDLDERTAGIVNARTAAVGGTGDLAYRFLTAACDWIREGGWIAMIQPRAALNAKALDKFREAPCRDLKPRMLYALDRADLFAGADVFVSLVVLGPNGPCLVPAPDDASFERWITVDRVPANWYLAARGRREAPSKVEKQALGDVFDVSASMTTSEAYAVKPQVKDSQRGKGQKLITTGLVEPGATLWGLEDCRYLGTRVRNPRITPDKSLPASLRKRLEKSARPKVIVAGLGSRVEAYFDEKGECQGAVSTYSIFHPLDDVEALQQVCEYLNSPDVTERLKAELGANALGGGSITIKKDWLRQLAP